MMMIVEVVVDALPFPSVLHLLHCQVMMMMILTVMAFIQNLFFFIQAC
jgi:hypothetical protein